MIENFKDLTPEQIKIAEKQLQSMGTSIDEQQYRPIKLHFENLHWVKVENVISKEMASLLYTYCVLATQRLEYMERKYGIDNVEAKHYGTFNDHQAPGDYSKYGDLIFDTLLYKLTDQMQLFTGKPLVPTYSYHRLYTTGTELVRHQDRESCEISTTLCLGYDVSNIDAEKYVDFDWPMFIKEQNGSEIPVHLKPGDMIIYRGCEVEHWREPFIGKNHAQVFLHYNEKEGQYNIQYDGRPVLGLSPDERVINESDFNGPKSTTKVID